MELFCTKTAEEAHAKQPHSVDPGSAGANAFPLYALSQQGRRAESTTASNARAATYISALPDLQHPHA